METKREVFVVDQFINAIRRKSVREVDKRDEWNSRYGHKPELRFDTELAASEFILHREKENLEKLRKQLSKTSNQVNKWENLCNIRRAR